ncbi:MAG: UvrD-helicase domain-containing protein [Lentisphaerae bacterium]|nr:UvrD-helicase domain-containing protein [Lentisphaerota bacterium]
MTQAPDRQVRQEALDPRNSFVLEAPAGSGKTALLTARFLALLADVRHPRQILAVTFTRKAAAEMAERITRTLNQAQAGADHAPSDAWEAHLWKLARNALQAHPDWNILWHSPDAFLIDTFHGFCARVARSWPLEAKTTPGAELLDEIAQQSLLDEAVAQYLHAFTAGQERLAPDEIAAFQRRLAQTNNNVQAVAGQLCDLLARRDRLEGLIPLFRRPSAADELSRRTEELAALYLKKLHDYFRRHKEDWSALRRTLDESKAGLARSLTGNIPGITLRDAPAWAAAAKIFLTQAGTPRKRFETKDFGPTFRKTPLANFIEELPAEIAEDLQFVGGWPETVATAGFEALCDFMRLAEGVLQRFDNLLATRGLDFMELELAALRAFDQVERPGESLIFFHEHLRHILVDEAQDMNDTQLRIVSALTEGWEPGDGRSLFVVGDPKQSIFRFRRAEVSLFESLKLRGLPRGGEAALPLRPLSLTANFRSRPSLVAFANKVFDQVMAAHEQAFDEVAFKPSQAVRAAIRPAEPITIAAFFYHRSRSSQASELSRPAAREQEARYVASRVAALHRGNLQATIAILIPVRTHLTPYIRAMEELTIPIRLMEGVPMLDCPEVRHLLNLFKALLRPHDDVAWAGTLRSPWCRVPATALEELAIAPQPALWSEKIAAAGAQAHPEIVRFNEALAKVRPDFGREPYAASLQRLWEELGGPAALARLGGADRVANCFQYFDLLGQCPAGAGEETLATLERLLEQAYTPPDPRAAFSSVTIMTIHKAKGLEFDHVFVVGLDRKALARAPRAENEAAFLMERLPQGELLAAAAGDSRTLARPLAYLLLSELGTKRSAAEYKRLFYVASTRARETLTLSGLIAQSRGNKEDPTLPAQPSAIAWLAAMNQQGAFTGMPVAVLKNPVPAPTPELARAPARPLPAPAPFEPEPLPYKMASPSQIEDETATAARPGVEETDPDARAWGLVSHRIFETLARGKVLPEPAAIASALAEEGLGAERLREKAQALRDECQRAWEFKTLADLRRTATEILPEWALEDCAPSTGADASIAGKIVIRIGRIDLVLKTASGIVLVDYKTGGLARSDCGLGSVAAGVAQDTEAWLAGEVARYRPQLEAYREMAAKVLGIVPRQIRPVLFFTAPLRWVEIDCPA